MSMAELDHLVAELTQQVSILSREVVLLHQALKLQNKLDSSIITTLRDIIVKD